MLSIVNLLESSLTLKPSRSSGAPPAPATFGSGRASHSRGHRLRRWRTALRAANCAALRALGLTSLGLAELRSWYTLRALTQCARQAKGQAWASQARQPCRRREIKKYKKCEVQVMTEKNKKPHPRGNGNRQIGMGERWNHVKSQEIIR